MIKDNCNIDITFDFTQDSIEFWDNFWERNNGLGAGGSDPDVASKTLQKYHSILWSKQLPNGEIMKLCEGRGSNYLTWDRFRFGSDSIVTSFRYNKYRYMIEKIKQYIPDYKMFMENYIRKGYTIGGSIIFPKRTAGINQTRGCNNRIKDRWDLTLECIRRFYNYEESPLTNCLTQDKDFFELFENFKGYVDYFFLQDCVTDDYNTVKFWIGDGEFSNYPLPQSPKEYVSFIEKELEFVEKRNKRIEQYCNS